MHTHIFPDKISDKAVEAVGSFYGIKMQRKGTSKDLVEDGEKIGATRYLVNSTATKPSQVSSINHFISQEIKTNSRFIGFGSLHPGSENLENDIEEIFDLKLSGIKLHPDFQEFNLDDPITYKMFDMCQGRLPFLIHMGDNRYPYSQPWRLLNVLEKFPKLFVIAAHLGGYTMWASLKTPYLSHPRIYMDTSSSLPFLAPEEAVSIIRKHGVEKVFFGTDYPMWDHVGEFERFMKLPLTDKEKEMILCTNAKRFLLQCHDN